MAAHRDKPTGAKAGWQLIGTEKRFENNVCRLREDEVQLEGDGKIKYAYLERDDAVIIVPVTTEGEVVMLKQYRYPVDEWCLEVPAGGTHDSCDAALEEVARKELREEIGATAQSLKYVNFFYPANSITNEKSHVFLAEGVELSREQKTEASESIEVHLISVGKAVELARTGAMKTAPCALAVLLCEPLLSRLDQHRPTADDLLET
ncbi:MAG: NUDIX hydrolase [Chthoniobacterales bacterium]|nr:NUDIX hydrolase [Chthoniobacterales bacterium]